MMSFEEFKEILREEVADKVDDEVTIVTVPKNNDIEIDALSVKGSSSNIAPIIYLTRYYDDYNNGRSIESIVNSIVSLIERESGINEDIINMLYDFETMREYIMLKLVNKDKNSLLLSKAPYLEYLDLAIVCIINVPLVQAGGEGCMIVLDNHLEMWGIDKDELFEIARRNSMIHRPAVIRGMNDIIRDMIVDYEEMDDIHALLDSADTGLYVITNQQGNNGAVTITYENVLRNFANAIDNNIFILPSSIHEAILVPEKYSMGAEELRNMVQTVNSTEVDEKEVLSDNVYYYDRTIDKITIA